MRFAIICNVLMSVVLAGRPRKSEGDDDTAPSRSQLSAISMHGNVSSGPLLLLDSEGPTTSEDTVVAAIAVDNKAHLPMVAMRNMSQQHATSVSPSALQQRADKVSTRPA